MDYEGLLPLRTATRVMLMAGYFSHYDAEVPDGHSALPYYF